MRRWLWRMGWLSLLALIIALLITTPALSRLVLWGLSHVEFVVNPVAAKVHTQGALRTQPIAAGSPEWLAWQWDARTASMLSINPNQSSAIPFSYASPMMLTHHVALPNASVTVGSHTWYMAQAIVVLGGGLGRDEHRDIVPNRFTALRLNQAILQQRATGLPLVLSGVESPWMQRWLVQRGVSASWLESRSMNTCENARFTALLLQQLGGAARVELVTDAYHMPRSRRLFALNGIETVPVIAPLPDDPASWWPSRYHLTHSRRAMHELMALTRDLWVGETNCREVP